MRARAGAAEGRSDRLFRTSSWSQSIADPIQRYVHRRGGRRPAAPGRAASSPPPPLLAVTHSINLSLSVDAQVAMRFSNGRWVRQVTLMSDEKAAFSRPRAEPSLELELNQWPCLFECLNKTEIESLKAAYAAESRMEDLRRTADQAERGLLSQ